MHRVYLTSAAITSVLLTACQTANHEPVVPPKLAYSEPIECTKAINLSKAIGISTNPKSVKRMMKNRTITRVQKMEISGQCLEAGDKSIPAIVFTLPSNLIGEVVYAGSILDANSIFAADVSTLNTSGETVRNFERDSYLFQGQQYGVQFRPSDDEAYVMIKADPELIGKERDTTELSIDSRFVSSYGVGGSYGGGGGTNLVGSQKSYNRTYSYDGTVQVRIVFPEQPEKETE